MKKNDEYALTIYPRLRQVPQDNDSIILYVEFDEDQDVIVRVGTQRPFIVKDDAPFKKKLKLDEGQRVDVVFFNDKASVTLEVLRAKDKKIKGNSVSRFFVNHIIDM